MFVNDYVEERIKELIQFKEYWEQNQKEAPGTYSRRLLECDWYAEELLYNAMEFGRESQ